MMEIKVTITAPDLSEAINHLAVALSGTGKAAPAIDDTALNNTEDKNIEAAPAEAPVQAPVTAPAAAPVAQAQTSAPVENPTPAAPTAPTAPVTPAPTQQTATPATRAKAYELDDIANAMAALIDDGKIAACMATIQKYGVPAINLLPKESYAAFAEDLKALGAKL